MLLNPINLLATTYLTAAEMSNVTVVLVYAALLVIVTSIISLRTNDPDPMLAGRTMPWWLIAGSIVGTSISSIAFLAIPSKGYALDFNYMIANVVEPLISTPIAIFFFVSFLRKSRDASIYTLLSDRFGKWASDYASIAFIAYSTVRMGVIVCLVSQAVHLICGADVVSVMVLTGAIVIFYTYMSGIEGVIWTDLFQTILLGVAGIASILFLKDAILDTEPGAFTSILLDENHSLKESLWKFEWRAVGTSCLFFAIMGFEFYAANQGIAQRYLVARSDRHAKIGLAVGAVFVPLTIGLFFVVGVLLYVLHQVDPSTVFQSLNSTEGAFAHFIANHFPNGLKGLAIVGILAAAMSTIDTGINSSSTVFICNLYDPYTKASKFKQTLLSTQIIRLSSVIFGVIGIFAGYLIYINGQNSLDFFWKGIGFISTGVVGLFILMRISKKVDKRSAIWGLVCGLSISCWMTFTEGKDYAWASPLHYMLTMPISTSIMVIVGLITSRLQKPKTVTLCNDRSHLPKIQTQVARRRKRRKMNLFADSLRPAPFYRLYAALAVIIALVLYIEGNHFGLSAMDLKFVGASAISLFLVAIIPFFIKNAYNKRYACFYLTLLGIGLPFLGAVGLFAHPEVPAYGYFYLITLIGLGLMVGWTMLGLISMTATAIAGQLVPFIYPQVGIPDNWALISIGALSIFTYYAISAARENSVTEKSLSRVHSIVNRIHRKVADASVELLQAKRQPNFQDADKLIKTVSSAEDMLAALIGATDEEPEEPKMELSVKETLQHVLKRFSKKAQQSIQIKGDSDFNVLGNRDAFEGVIFHILDNAFYYIDRGEASKVWAVLDANKKTLSIMNDGPAIKPEDSLYIFDLGYTSGKDSLGLGLTYCKKMLEGMRSGIRLLSKPTDAMVHFCLYFPKYAELPEEAKMYHIQDEMDA